MTKKFDNECVDDWLLNNKNQFERVGEYTGFDTPMEFKCLVCDNNWTTSFGNLKRTIKQCPSCYGNKKQSTKDVLKWIEENNAPIKLLGEYERYHTHIKCECTVCNHVWGISFAKMKSGRCCPKCAKNLPLNNEEVDEWLLNNTNISRVSEYVKTNNVMTFECFNCGKQWQTTFNSIKSSGTRCPNCLYSRGEYAISDVLNSLNIRFEREYRFDDCRYKYPLPFDFAVFKDDELLALIEYNGKQHYEPIGFFGGEESFKYLVIRDNLKSEYCKSKDIRLLSIPYWEYDNIEKIITKELRGIC